MDLASLELCTALYKLSGWDDCRWCFRDVSNTKTPHWMTDLHSHEHDKCFPNYDLGYLLRKLPPTLHEADSKAGVRPDNSAPAYYLRIQWSWTRLKWVALYQYWHDGAVGADETPENACAKLAIELFKLGIIPPNTLNKDINK